MDEFCLSSVFRSPKVQKQVQEIHVNKGGKKAKKRLRSAKLKFLLPPQWCFLNDFLDCPLSPVEILFPGDLPKPRHRSYHPGCSALAPGLEICVTGVILLRKRRNQRVDKLNHWKVGTHLTTFHHQNSPGLLDTKGVWSPKLSGLTFLHCVSVSLSSSA